MTGVEQPNGQGTAEVTGDELAPGTQLSNGTYTIVKHLKTGGFGITYLATDTLGRRVVIKECFPAGMCERTGGSVVPRSRLHVPSVTNLMAKFVEEAHSLAKVTHPNVVKVHQVFKENETAYMALDYVEGHDLVEVMSDPALALTPQGVRSTLLKLLDAVSAVHEKGLLHRDISPDNILIGPDRSPILIDFGSARTQERSTEAAASTLHVVKDGYSPQELYLSGGGDQGPWSDLYSLAATFYHVVSGDAPENSQSRLASLAMNTADPCVPLRGRFDAYDPAFLAAIDKAMSVLPKERIQSAREWISAISDGKDAKTQRLAEPTPTRQVTPMTRVTRMEAEASRKKIGPVVMVGGVLALAVVAIGVSLAMPDSDTATVARVPAKAVTAGTAAAEAPKPAAAPVVEETAAVVQPDPAPVAAEAPPVPQPVATQPAAQPGRPDVSPMTSNWTIALPFAAAASSSTMVDSVSEGAPLWMEPGMQITAVNGTPIESLLDIPAILRQTQTPGELPVLTATLTTLAEAGASPVDQTVDLPVVHRLALISGAEFLIHWADGAWRTEVVALPNDYNGEMRVGDIIVGHVGSGQRLDGPTSLKKVLEEALLTGAGNTTLAVQQGEQMWVVTFPLPR
jgi:serine/threonine protein kinase